MIEVRIAGIPAQVKVTLWVPRLPAITRAEPHKCCEEEPAEIEYEVYDASRAGQRHGWRPEDYRRRARSDCRNLSGEQGECL
jgi:hypothetical protein